MTAIFDPDALDQLQELSGDGSLSLVTEIFQVYLDTTPPALNEIDQALKTQDNAKIRKLAHSIKSSSASLGLLQVASLCLSLEKSEDEKIEFDQIQTRVKELRLAYNEGVCVVRSEINQRGSILKIAS